MEEPTIVEPRRIFEEKANDGGSGGSDDNGGENGSNSGKGKNNRTILIAVVVAVVLCCCCLLVAGAGYYGYIRSRAVNVFPVEPSDQLLPQSDSETDGPPSGGLGNDVLKNDTWQAIAPAAIALGCDRPIGADSTIEVIQQPDAGGVWVEHWTVACQSGDTYAFEVTFILDATGATYNIKPLK